MNPADYPSSRFLFVDDNERLRERLVDSMTRRGFTAFGAESTPDALATIDQTQPSHVVVDLKMPGPGGLELVSALAKRDPVPKIIVLTGYGSITTAVDAVRLGALQVLQKPADIDMILAAFARADQPPQSEAPEYRAPSLARAEWEHIQRVLADCGGNISHAADRLGLHRRTLQRKLSKYPPKD